MCVEFETEMEAKQGYNGMMGFKFSMKNNEYVLYVKRLQSIAAPTNPYGEGEVFKSLIEDKPTKCLVLRGSVAKEEIETREDYKEIEFYVMEEMLRYGNCIKVHCPRPPLFGDPKSEPGYGKVYVKFDNEQTAEICKHSLYRRRFNSRFIESMYYPEEKFNKYIFD